MTATTPARSGVSPSSSPRLPSPPPIPEVQYGPQSPSISSVNIDLPLDASTKPDEGAARRIRPGTKAADMALGPPLIPLNQLDSAFQLQEHLKALYSNLTHTAESTHNVPMTRETALQIATPPQINENEMVDRNLWLYELCRFLVLKANLISCALMIDGPPCSSITCPEMRASEWQYLCAVHEPPKSCCAIDYCNHTLDWAANVLTSPKHFPSRLALGGDTGNVFQSMRQLTNIFRRVYRIFAHAWFQHREVFWTVEGIHGLYMFFKTVCDEYQLIGEDNYTIPPEASGLRDDANVSHTESSADSESKIQVLRKEMQPQSQENGQDQTDDQSTTTISTGATTRRHKHTPSTGSHVGTIAEGQEDEDEANTTALKTESMAPSKKLSTPDRSLVHGLGRLNINSSVPRYVPEFPSDPTPTTAMPDRDPLALMGRRDSGFEEEVTSPSGGSVRTGGPDVLHAILGHMDELENLPDEPSDAETAIVDDENPFISHTSETGKSHDARDHEDDDETMEKLEVPFSHARDDETHDSDEQATEDHGHEVAHTATGTTNDSDTSEVTKDMDEASDHGKANKAASPITKAVSPSKQPSAGDDGEGDNSATTDAGTLDKNEISTEAEQQ